MTLRERYDRLSRWDKQALGLFLLVAVAYFLGSWVW